MSDSSASPAHRCLLGGWLPGASSILASSAKLLAEITLSGYQEDFCMKKLVPYRGVKRPFLRIGLPLGRAFSLGVKLQSHL